MKKVKLLVFLCGLTFAVSCGQQKRYVSYKVQKGETVSDIAEKHNISEADLLRLNPDISSDVQANMVIIVPNAQTAAKPNNHTTNDNTEVVSDSENKPEVETETTENETVFTTTINEYKTHTVQQGETVYRITKLYDISKDELLKLNPEFPDLIYNKVSIGQVLKVQAIKKDIVVDQEYIKNKYVTHEVKSKETVFGITKFYNITKEDLIKLNPELPGIVDNNLQPGQILKIRKIEEVTTTETTNRQLYIDSINTNSSINITLLLPFNAKQYDSIASKDIFSNNNLAKMTTDFYLGAEIAVDSIRKQFIDVNVKVFDTGKKEQYINTILRENDFSDTHAIIGPFYSEEAAMTAQATKVPVIFPHYSKNQDKFSSSKLIKTGIEKEANLDYLLNYLQDNYHGENVFVISDGKTKANAKATRIQQNLLKHDSISKVHILKPKKGYIRKNDFTTHIKPGSRSWVIIATEDKSIVDNALNNTIGLPKDATVQVFSEAKTKAFSSVDNNTLARVYFTYVTQTFVDEKAEDVKNFNKKYLAKNNCLPTEYAVKGFDITYDTLIRLASGNNLKDTYKEGVSYRIGNKFDYKNKTFGTTSNQGLFIVKYNPDLNITRLK